MEEIILELSKLNLSLLMSYDYDNSTFIAVVLDGYGEVNKALEDNSLFSLILKIKTLFEIPL